jgi:hypothetical protein
VVIKEGVIIARRRLCVARSHIKPRRGFDPVKLVKLGPCYNAVITPLNKTVVITS